jgi:DNA-binding Lrp family transcriptional regulator
MIPANVRYDNNLSYFDRLLFGEISTNIVLNDGEWCCCEPNEYFAQAMDVTPAKVARGIKALEKAGYIGIEMLLSRKCVGFERRMYQTVEAFNNSSLPNPYNR